MTRCVKQNAPNMWAKQLLHKQEHRQAPANQTQPYKPVQCRRLPCGMLSTSTVSSMYNRNQCFNHDRQPRVEKASLKQPPAHPAVIPCQVGPSVTGSLYRPAEHGRRLLSPISPVCQSCSTVADSKGARQHTVLPAPRLTCWNDTRFTAFIRWSDQPVFAGAGPQTQRHTNQPNCCDLTRQAPRCKPAHHTLRHQGRAKS